MLTASVALAPSRLLLSVPSRSISVRSRNACSLESRPSTASLISVLMCSIARSTPLAAVARGVAVAQLDRLARAGRGARRHRGAAHRSALEQRTSHSTVGLPRLSRISRPTMSTIALILVLVRNCWVV